ncbi:MAG: GH3 auxin-responsive promoter family protein [Bacteriovoracaceae bacterium]|nr:GH3 auxin-responsive promoter family protein [Bacteriovoracaceae bacterium]
MPLGKFFNSMYKFSQKGKYDLFVADLKRAKEVQKKFLMDLIIKNRDTEFGKKHDFSRIRSIEHFRNLVPISIYEDYSTYIDMIARGKQQVLTLDPVIMFERTSGSSGVSKLIPYTKDLFDDFYRATSTWIYDIYDRHQNLKDGKSYWSISPNFVEQEVTKGGIPVGMKNDADYFSSIERSFLKEMLVTPSPFDHNDLFDFQVKTSVSLIESEDLTFISVWSPTFITEILKFIEHNSDTLRPLLSPQALSRFENALNSQGCDFKTLWPRVELISCWKDAASSSFIPEIVRRLPGVDIQGKGLLLTEGIITIPFMGLKAPLLAINSHFFEFMDDDGKIFDFDQLVINSRYTPIITTSGGLYRYNTNDTVEVVDYYLSVPLLSFVGRKNTVDLCGERLNEDRVHDALKELNEYFDITPSFQMLAPILDKENRRYALFLEHENDDLNLEDVADYLDRIFLKSHHYNMCRLLDQLKKVEVLSVKKGIEHYKQRAIDNGIKGYGDIKPCYLSSHSDWRTIFGITK